MARRSTSLGLLLVFFLPLVLCKRYDLALGWNISVTSKARAFEAAEQAGSYRILHAMTQDELILSDDKGKFGLSFFSFNGSNSYYLSVVIGTSLFTNSSGSGTVVWTANRNMPVSANGILQINRNGTLNLMDSDGKVVWSPTQSSAVSGIELQESGNLALYNSTGGIIWQSFDEPSDVLLEGQSLHTGQKLVGTSNSSTMAEGNFQGVVDNSGFGMFLRSSGDLEPYFLWPIWNQGNAPSDVSTISKECPAYETVITYNASLLSMVYQKKLSAGFATSNNQKCSPDLSATLTASGSLHHLKVHPNGSLVQRSYDSSTSAWTTSAALQQSLVGSCLPFSCPANGICMRDGGCQCMKPGAGNRTCPSLSDLPVTCNELEAENHHFWTVPGASYFSNKYTKADKISTLEDCQGICLSNCSCQALFYNNVSSSCYFVKEVHGSLELTSDSSSTAFLKLQNPRLVLPKKSSRLRNILAIVGGVTSLLVAVILFIAFWLWRRQQRRLKQMQDALDAALRGAPHRYTYKELKQATRDFSSLLGAGGSGSVYQGILSDGSRVAIKKLESSSQGEKEFITEVNTIGSISHVNIVKLCGYCASGRERMLVYEHVANNSLDKWLFNREDDSVGALLDWKTRYGIALGAAKGLAYLHGESRLLIMHLDVKPQNILLDEHFEAKISDFGMSKLILDREASQVTTIVRGTPGYLAPEWLLNSVATKKCDVYSYGMVLLELIGGKRNIRQTTPEFHGDEEMSWYFPAWVVDRVREGRILDVVDRDLVDTLDEQMTLEAVTLIRVALWCIQTNPGDRPSMDAVVQMIEGHKAVADPPLSFHFAIQCPGIINLSSKGNSKISVVSLSSIEQVQEQA